MFPQGSPHDDFPALQRAPKSSHTSASNARPPQRMHPAKPSVSMHSSASSSMYRGQHQPNLQVSFGSSRGSISPQPPQPPQPPRARITPPPPSTPMYPAHPSEDVKEGKIEIKSELGRDSRQDEGWTHGKTMKTERASKESRKDREDYGLLGILKVIRMTDQDLNTLALGMDLTSLGLNLNSSECLYASFASPWSEVPARKEPEYYLPSCYYMQPPQLKAAHLQKFMLETLCYIFHRMPGEILQAYVAQELYNRKWYFHTELKSWFEKSDDPSKAPWSYFDPDLWERRDYWEHIDESKFLTEADVRIPREA